MTNPTPEEIEHWAREGDAWRIWKAIEAERGRVREVAEDLRTWSNGALAPVTGMGAGLHAEMWPHIGPSAAKLLRELADRLEGTDA